MGDIFHRYFFILGAAEAHAFVPQSTVLVNFFLSFRLSYARHRDRLNDSTVC